MHFLHFLTLAAPSLAAAGTISFPAEERSAVPGVHVFPLTRARNSFPHIKKSRRRSVGGIAAADVLPFDGGNGYYATVTIGKHKFQLLIDTGSSDLWISKTGFQCQLMDETTGSFSNANESACGVPATYSPGKEYAKVPNVHFNISYGDGGGISGDFGMADVTLGGIKVKTQIAAADQVGAFNGTGVVSGFLGLAYPAETYAFKDTTGTNNTEDDLSVNQAPYDPIFTTMWKKKLISPMFSLALNRPSALSAFLPDGYIAFGGLVSGWSTAGVWGKADIQTVKTGALPTVLTGPQFQGYVITPDAILFGSPSNSTALSPVKATSAGAGFQMQIDSGATLAYLEPTLFTQLAALYSPPAVFDKTYNIYSVPCDAVPPQFAVQIGGVVFPVDGRDMVVDDETGRGLCQTGVHKGYVYAPYVLGDTFLKNVVTVFDVGKSQMRFQAR